MPSMRIMSIVITGALLVCAVCTTTPTQSPPSRDKDILYVGNTVPASAVPVKEKNTSSFSAPLPIEVPEPPAMAIILFNTEHSKVVRYVEPKCNSPTLNAYSNRILV